MVTGASSLGATFRRALLQFGTRLTRVPFGLISFALALLPRLLLVLATSNLGIGLDDMFQYDMLARSLASGNGFRWYAPVDAARLAPYMSLDVDALQLDPRGLPTTFRAPLYPALISLFYMIFGAGEGRFFAVRLGQAVLGAALAPLTYVAARQVLVQTALAHEHMQAERAARIASVTIAAYPMLIAFPLALATENLFCLLVLAALIALLEISTSLPYTTARSVSSKHAARLAIAAGVLLGLSALTRSVVMPMAVVAIAWLWFVLGRPRLAVLSGLALVCVIAPWIVRNSLLEHKPTGIETSMGYNLYVGYHPASTGDFQFGPSLDLLSILDDGTRDEVGTRLAIEFMRNEPARFPYLAIRRLGHFFDLEWRPFLYFYTNGVFGSLPPAVVLTVLFFCAVPFILLCTTATLGVATAPRSPRLILLLLFLAAYLLPHVLILSEARFHLALLPLIAIFSGRAMAARETVLSVGAARRALVWLVLGSLTYNWASHLARSWQVIQQLIGPNGSRLHLPY